MQKKLHRAVWMLLLVLFLTGCRTEYGRDDVKDFLKSSYDMPKFRVSKNRETFVGEDGFTDYLWEVQLKDENKTTFYVVDDQAWGMEWTYNKLKTDFDDVILEKLYWEYEEPLTFDLEKVMDENGRTYCITLVGQYDSKQELSDRIQELEQFLRYYEEHGYGTSFYGEILMMNPLRDHIKYVIHDGDYHFYSDYEEKENRYEDALTQYVQVCLDYRFEEKLNEITPEEIDMALEDYPYRVGLLRDAENPENCEFYEDLCGSRFGYGISFGTLYEILLREGFDVTGDSWHFCFQGVDGSIYEISYDFCDYVTDEGQNGYYYLKDDEIIPMAAFFYNHFCKNEVEAMTGLSLFIGEKN